MTYNIEYNLIKDIIVKLIENFVIIPAIKIQLLEIEEFID